MQSETLAQEFARLVKEYHEADDHTKPEAWNLLADYAADNAAAISTALSDQERMVEVKALGTLTGEVRELVVAAREFWDIHNDLSAESRALDKALEAFAERVPYDNEPEDVRAAADAYVEAQGFENSGGIIERAFEAGAAFARSALVDGPVEPVAWLRPCRIAYLSGEERDGHVVSSKNDPRAFPVYASPIPHREGEDSAEAIPHDLVRRCKEILDWHQNAVLEDGELRALARRIRAKLNNVIDAGESLRHAEEDTKREAMRLILAIAAARRGSATATKGQADE